MLLASGSLTCRRRVEKFSYADYFSVESVWRI